MCKGFPEVVHMERKMEEISPSGDTCTDSIGI